MHDMSNDTGFNQAVNWMAQLTYRISKTIAHSNVVFTAQAVITSVVALMFLFYAVYVTFVHQVGGASKDQLDVLSLLWKNLLAMGCMFVYLPLVANVIEPLYHKNNSVLYRLFYTLLGFGLYALTYWIIPYVLSGS